MSFIEDRPAEDIRESKKLMNGVLTFQTVKRILISSFQIPVLIFWSRDPTENKKNKSAETRPYSLERLEFQHGEEAPGEPQQLHFDLRENL